MWTENQEVHVASYEKEKNYKKIEFTLLMNSHEIFQLRFIFHRYIPIWETIFTNKMIFANICTFSVICPICPVVQQVIFEINKLYTKIVVTPRCPRQFVNVREGLPVPRRL